MKTLLFPLVIAMVITFVFGYFSNEFGHSDIAMICIATFAAIAANVFRQKEQLQYLDLHTQQDGI